MQTYINTKGGVMNIEMKREQVLAGVTIPEMCAAGAKSAIVVVEAPAREKHVEEETPFFGGYMEDMLEDMGMVETEEEVREACFIMS